MDGMRKLLLEKANHADVAVADGFDPESIVGFLKEKLAQLLQFFQDAVGFLLEKLDDVLPPETRSATLGRWLRFALTVVLPIALGLLLLYWCCKCCCCAARRSGGLRTMKAPGRNGALMPRPSFESDPRGYFINLRAKKDLVF